MISNIQKALDDKGLTHADVAKALGVSRQAVQKWAAGGDMSKSNLIKLSEYLDASISFLCGINKTEFTYRVTEQDAPKTSWIRVPILDVDASCGGGSINDSNNIVGAVDFYPEFLNSLPGVTNKHGLHIVNAHGDSMEPTIKNRSFCLVDPSQNVINSDGIYCFQNDDQLFIKRIQRNIDGSLTIISDNPAYHPVTIKRTDLQNAKILGKIVFVFNGSAI